MENALLSMTSERGSPPAFRSSLYTLPSASSPAPPPNATYARSFGAVYATSFRETAAQPALPAALRPQFQSLTEAELLQVERRMERQNAAAQRDVAIENRAAMAAQQRRTEAGRRNAKTRLQAERRANAAANAEALRIHKEYNGLCRW